MSSKKSSKKDKLNQLEEANDLEVRKPKKAKKKSENMEEPDSGVVKEKKKKKKSANNNTEPSNNVNQQDLDLDGLIDLKDPYEDADRHLEDEKKDEITWPSEDLTILLNQIEKCIPEQDTVSFMTRLDKVQWDQVVFKNYSIEECKRIWSLLAKKIRRFRLLQEVIHDAREYIRNPPTPKKRGKAHPDMPKRPLTSYFLFYMNQKDQTIAENPGIDLPEISRKIGVMYKSLSPEKKAIYEKLAANAKEEYEEKMKEFYANHPEYKDMKATAAAKERVVKERIPKKPLTPFNFYYQAELKKCEVTGVDKAQVKETCRDKWKQMSDKKKLVWIDFAENKQIEYERDLQDYKATHPDYSISQAPKLTLNKEEKSLKERAAGKPIKPPNSAYALFARNILQSEDVKNIPTKQRLIFVSTQWKECSETEKQHYKELLTNLMDQYKIDYANYLSTLPEEQRKLEMAKTAPKRKKEDHPDSPKSKKRKTSKSSKAGEDKKLKEPEQPPVSAFKYFAKTYTGKESAQQAWKRLGQAEKDKWEQELVKKKHEYIENFEKFLKSLTKEELAAFSHARNLAKQQAQDASDDDEDGDDESAEDSDEDSSESESENDSSDED